MFGLVDKGFDIYMNQVIHINSINNKKRKIEGYVQCLHGGMDFVKMCYFKLLQSNNNN